jgi:SNF2 family DNA or RNA helicase
MNFSVPGSGKTATVLAAFQYLKEHKKIDKLLVIGPKNCFKSWKDEAKTVLGMQMNKILELNTVSDYAGKRIQLEYNYDQSDIILLNFAGTLNASSLLQQYIDDKVLVVFDEIHRLKKLDGTIFKATYPIVETTKYRVALTGTPLPNGYIDLYNQFLLLFGDYTRTFFGFVSYRLSEKDKIFITEGKTSAEVSLKMSPFFVRLSKEDLKVPKPNDDHVKRVEENSSKINKYLRSGSGSSIGSLFNYLKIGVIPENINPDDKANDMDLEEYEEKNNQRYFDVNVRTEKINLFLSLIDEIIGREESVVVWFNFIASMKKIFEIVSNERNYSIAMIYGATPGETREKIIDEFNEGKIKILLTNPHTLAESVSLHKKCNNAIYMEMNYNLSQYLQSRDRIHRLGIEPNRETNYYILLTKYNGYSIDEKIYKALHKKEFRMYDTIEGQMQINRDEKSIKEKLVEEIKR